MGKSAWARVVAGDCGGDKPVSGERPRNEIHRALYWGSNAQFSGAQIHSQFSLHFFPARFHKKNKKLAQTPARHQVGMQVAVQARSEFLRPRPVHFERFGRTFQFEQLRKRVKFKSWQLCSRPWPRPRTCERSRATRLRSNIIITRSQEQPRTASEQRTASASCNKKAS